MYKKTTSNDRLNKKQSLFFSIGLLISMLLVIVAFEWKTEVEPIVLPDLPDRDRVYIMDPVATRHEVPDRPKPKISMTEKTEKQRPVEVKEIKEELTKIAVELPSVEYSETDPVPIVELEKEEAPVYFSGAVAVEASFEGGREAFYHYLSKSLRNVNTNIKGTMVLGFIINKKGEITDIKIIRGLNEKLEQEVVRVLENCPPWSPAQQNNEPVRVRMKIPIRFR